MLCQNCKLRQANVFIKRSINGKSKELHLCSDCAEKLGYSDMFNKPVFSGFGSLFENFFNAPSILSGESFFSLPSYSAKISRETTINKHIRKLLIQSLTTITTTKKSRICKRNLKRQ